MFVSNSEKQMKTGYSYMMKVIFPEPNLNKENAVCDVNLPGI